MRYDHVESKERNETAKNVMNQLTLQSGHERSVRSSPLAVVTRISPWIAFLSFPFPAQVPVRGTLSHGDGDDANEDDEDEDDDVDDDNDEDEWCALVCSHCLDNMCVQRET